MLTDLQTILGRLEQRYLGEANAEPIDPVLPLADGHWADLDYADRSSPGLKCFAHLKRLLSMVVSYRSSASSSTASALREPIHSALQYWIATDPETTHVWYNQIGVPVALGKILVLLRHELSDFELTGGARILRKANIDGVLIYAGKPATGQNLIWEAGIQIVAGCLTGSPDEVRTNVARAAKEFLPAQEEGLQIDASFHQHGPLLYSGGYGCDFAIDCARLCGALRDTAFAIPTESIDAISMHVLDGIGWMIRHDQWDFGVIGREIARLGKTAASIALACDELAALNTPRRAEFVALRDRIRECPGAPAQEGNRMFWRSDFMSHQRRGFYVSARMTSNRMFGNESGNGEGVRNFHLGDGATCLMTTGDEYRHTFPLWDWRRLPGVTCAQSSEPLPENTWAMGSWGATPFVGGASDGRAGAAAFDYHRAGVRARKAWFFFDDRVVCLGAGIACETGQAINTSIEQRRAGGDTPVNGLRYAGAFDHEFTRGAAVIHAGVGYLVTGESSRGRVQVQSRTGAWRDISTFDGSPDRFSEDLFSLWIDHGVDPRGATYHYTLLPGITPEALSAEAASPRVIALRNEPAVQAVHHTELNLTMAAFYEPGALRLPDGSEWTVDHPCVLLIDPSPTGWMLTASDPTQTIPQLTVNRFPTPSSDTHFASCAISFPRKPMAGSSVRMTLRSNRECPSVR